MRPGSMRLSSIGTLIVTAMLILASAPAVAQPSVAPAGDERPVDSSPAAMDQQSPLTNESLIAFPVSTDNRSFLVVLSPTAQSNDVNESVTSPGHETSSVDTPVTTIDALAIYNTTTTFTCDADNVTSSEACQMRNDKFAPGEPERTVNFSSPPQVLIAPAADQETGATALRVELTDSAGRTITSDRVGTRTTTDGSFAFTTDFVIFDGNPQTQTECGATASPTEPCTTNTENVPASTWALVPSPSPERPVDTGVNTANLLIEDGIRAPSSVPNTYMGVVVSGIASPNFLLRTGYGVALNNVDDPPTINESYWPGDLLLETLPVDMLFVPQDPTFPDDFTPEESPLPANATSPAGQPTSSTLTAASASGPVGDRLHAQSPSPSTPSATTTAAQPSDGNSPSPTTSSASPSVAGEDESYHRAAATEASHTSDTGNMTVTPTAGSGPGFGLVLALVTLLGLAVGLTYRGRIARDS